MRTRKTNHHTPRPTGSTNPAAGILGWYNLNRRELPWRTQPGESPDPYRVWISEIMLQQTTVATVCSYFGRFVRRWPDVYALAAAPLDDVLSLWAGLGYYARARNLHRGAQTVVEQFGGIIPRRPGDLLGIPGIGHYTAGAIAAIAFQEPVAALDTNAERVLARYLAFDEPLPAARTRLRLRVEKLVPHDRPGDFAQALMDFGSLICVPKNPRCSECPIAGSCKARRLGRTDQLPRKRHKTTRRLARAVAFVAVDDMGSIYLVRRPEHGLFGGMMQPPLTPLRATFPRHAAAVRQAPFQGEWRCVPGAMRHVLTHMELEIRAYVARFSQRPNGAGIWLTRHEVAFAALPTAMRKILGHALSAA